MSNTVYLTRNGLLEPLGQSQVFAYLRGLSREHSITLITYEKAEDWEDSARMARARADCDAHGIRWLPQRFHYSPRIIAPALSMLRMTWLAWHEVRKGRAELIHARSYIPAAVALAVHRLSGVPFIFDMRALWPEELITAGRLRRGSYIHRAISWIERRCLARSAAVVSLTKAAVLHLRQEYPKELEGQRISVIPTCADLERFIPAPERACGPMVHGCIGTVLSGWFRTDWLASWLAVAAARDPQAQFDIATRDNAEQVRHALDPQGKLANRMRIGPRASEDMPKAVQKHDISIMFYAGGEVSELGRSPTRMAEVLGCGLPVVANGGVGDVASVIEENRVGVLVEGPEPQQIHDALDALDALMQDPELPSRCRKTAEEIFSLDAGTEAYRSLYADLLAERPR
ncbi:MULTISPECIES: glycosyltransferase family 4 protein [Halomonas]|uniref:Glycosyltransferase involved in cell wall biosynthesis n=1 Tax=Halomonas ventosae TaxID=229007 RepID=A0A4R6I4Q2_9GAMM|nr:glycosyltransferase family 4 protein [Halomonas ventosae]TDO16642.1 glycosyltransferase involved in cell wall biosynthesis [Halomonas ventosae]